MFESSVPHHRAVDGRETISRSKQCRLHRNWLKNKRRVDCNQCLRKNQHFTSVMNATKHGDPPITVAGATKKRSKARKVYMPSGATIMHRYVHHHNARLPPRWSSQPHARVPSTVQACAGTTLWRCSLRRGWRQISDGACSQAARGHAVQLCADRVLCAQGPAAKLHRVHDLPPHVLAAGLW